MSPSTPVQAETFDTATLGRSVLLGELYNARKSQFLGVQLYQNIEKSDGEGKITSTKIDYTDLKLAMSNSFQDKANLMDINAELSLEVLGGLVSVKGSASYLKNTKSSTNERAWSLSLKLRKTEERLLFAQLDPVKDVLKQAVQDYVVSNVATHFVSSIVFGGNVIVNLAARDSKVSEDEKIKGKLELELNMLKGAIDLNAKADADIKGKFEDIKDSFDITLYGDVSLDKVPVKPADVLEIFKEASERIGTGVPIAVKLQPIPTSIRDTAATLYRLEQSSLNGILAVFGKLDDIRSRFEVLQKECTLYKAFAPALAAQVSDTNSKFHTTHQSLVTRLATFIREFYSSGKLEDQGELLTAATTLFDNHNVAPNAYNAPTYPDNLAALEKCYTDLHEFVTVMKDLGVQLSVFSDITRSASKNSTLTLFAMPPLGTTTVGDNLVRFSSLASRGSTWYANQRPRIPTQFIYVENATQLAILPAGKKLSLDSRPGVWLGTKDDEGQVTWAVVDTSGWKGLQKSELNVNLYNVRDMPPSFCLHQLDGFDNRAAYTLLAKSNYAWGLHNDQGYPDLLLKTQLGSIGLMLHRTAVQAVLKPNGGDEKSMFLREFPIDTTFTVAFVQDIIDKQWRFYVDGAMIKALPIQPEYLARKEEMHLLVGLGNYNGNLSHISFQSAALEEEAILAASKKLLNDTTAAQPEDVIRKGLRM